MPLVKSWPLVEKTSKNANYSSALQEKKGKATSTSIEDYQALETHTMCDLIVSYEW